ncbi:MAG: hypothetical protein N2746_10655, partial [Deltaproteobacteria bacterium]|nr:hypothetical protein [Deltaproteobacteria bacterium]
MCIRDRVSSDINNVHKAFKVLDAINLIIVPFSSWSSNDYSYVSGIQLIDYFNDENNRGLVKRGLVDHSGWVQRGIPYAGNKLLTVSNEAVQVVDIANRDKPILNSSVDLARNVIDFMPINTKYGLELSTTTLYYWGAKPKSKVNLVPLSDPNTYKPYQSLELNGYFSKLYRVGQNFVAVGYVWDSKGGEYKVRIISFALKNSILKLIDSAEFAGNFNWYDYGCMMYGNWVEDIDRGYYGGGCYGNSSVAEQLDESRLVFADLKYQYFEEDGHYRYKYVVILKQVKLKSDGSIEVSDDFSIEFPDNAYPGGLVYQNMKAYITYYVPLNTGGNYSYAKAYVKVADLSRFDDVKFSNSINIPGTVIGASLSGHYVYTIDYQYDVSSKDYYRIVGYLNTLLLTEEKAYLQDRLEILPAASDNLYTYIGGYVVKDEKFYYTLFTHSWSEKYEDYRYSNLLKTVNLVDPENINVSSSISLKNNSTSSMRIVSDRLFITAYDYVSGLLVYKLTDPLFPEFEGFYRTDGWTSAENVTAFENKAYVTAGPYGVQVISLR